MSFYIGFFGWFAFIALHLWHQWKLWKMGKRPSYLSNFIFRAFAGLVCIILMNPEFDPAGDPGTILDVLPELIFEVSTFYTLFDPLLNFICKRTIDHRGEKSGWIDPHLSRAEWWILKAASLIIAILSTYALWQNLN